MSDTEEIDELDELLGLLDEEEETDVKQQKIQQKEVQQKTGCESELYAHQHCKIRIEPSSRVINAEELKLRLRRMHFVSLINLPLKIHNKAIISNFVIIGILASKMIRNSKNGNKYLLIKMDDFKATISCFIFNTEIIEKFYKIQPGTVLCIAVPQIMEERKQSQNHSNNITLKIERFEQILIVGKSMDFGFCPKILNNRSSRCNNVINSAKHDLCAIHKAQQYKKYASKRNDANRSSLSKLRNRNTKKSLSGSMTKHIPMNGITMSQMKKAKTTNNKKKSANRINHEDNRKMNRNILLASTAITNRMSSRLRKYGVGNKNILHIQDNERKKEMSKILDGKKQMPFLGSNWNTRKYNNERVVLAPKCVQKSQTKAQEMMRGNGIVLDAPDPNDTTNMVRKHRKRSFADMMDDKVDPNDGNPKKKCRLANVVDTSNMDDIINKKSLNDNIRKEVEKENVYKHLNDLEEEEKLHDELDQVTSVQITVYVCKARGCALKNKIYEKPNCFCKAHQTNVVKTFGRKYFWKCSVCCNKTNTLNTKRIKYKCNKCGRRKFVAASAYTLTKPKLNKQRLVLKNNKA